VPKARRTLHTFVCSSALQRRPELGAKRPYSDAAEHSQDGSILARLESVQKLFPEHKSGCPTFATSLFLWLRWDTLYL